jgi:hypothetical protein
MCGRMTMRTLLSVTALVLVAGCGGDSEPSATNTASEEPAAVEPTPRDLPTEWADSIDNPFLPYQPGAKWTYEKTTPDSTEIIVLTVAKKTKTINDIEATIVRERVTEDGELIEEGEAWYAQDTEGNVWNLGDSTKAYEDGKVETEGWEVGADGAQAGIAMLADPQVDDKYLQMFQEDEAEDQTAVLSVDESVEGPAGSWSGVLKTEDTTPLEPDLVEHKYYAEGVGSVQQETIEGEEEKVVLTEYEKP